MNLPAPLRALGHRDYRLFWSGQVVSQIGSWMQVIGHGWLILELTDSPLQVSLISVLQFAPMLLFSLLAGAVVDRLPKRRVILVTQTGMALAAFALAWLVSSGQVQYWHVAVLAFLVGTLWAFDTPGRHSFVVDMVGKEDLVSAQALNGTTLNTARMVGPAVAGLLVARYGVAPAFLLNGLSFLAVITALLAIRAEGRPAPRSGRSLLREVRQGLAFSLREPHILVTLAGLVVLSLFAASFQILVPLLAKQELGLDAAGYGLLTAAQGMGAVGGAVLLTWQSRRPIRYEMVAGAAALVCTTTLLMGFARHFWPAAALLLVIGLMQALFYPASNTLMLVAAPDSLRGRVMSLFPLANAGTAPIGAAFTGMVAEWGGVHAAFGVGGALGLLCIALLFLWWQTDLRHRPTPVIPEL
ncbi:MAG: MFS transporter [Bacillota bacterium]